MAYCRKAHWLVGWGRALGNHQGGATCVNQVDGVSDMVLPLYGSVWERAQKGSMLLPGLLSFVLEEAVCRHLA